MEELVEKAKKGDRNAFTKLIMDVENDLYKIAKTRITNEADIEDAIQETELSIEYRDNIVKLITPENEFSYKTYSYSLEGFTSCIKDIANYFKNSFVSDYIKCLKKIVSANELIACFSDNPNNFLMWSHYSDSHKGVCLIFNTKEYKNLPSILLSEYSANEYNYYSFYQVKYQPYNQPINFFSNIHHTMMSIYRDYWYIDSYLIKKGEKSKLYHDYVYDIYNEGSMKSYDKNNPFFNEYLENTKLQIIFKLQHWKEEREYRLILFDYIKQISEIKGEIYKYKFESLQGIIFGLNTPFNERNQIINIIKNKCLEENRTDFKFYEMQIDENIGKLKQVELNINLFDTPFTEPNHE